MGTLQPDTAPCRPRRGDRRRKMKLNVVLMILATCAVFAAANLGNKIPNACIELRKAVPLFMPIINITTLEGFWNHVKKDAPTLQKGLGDAVEAAIKAGGEAKTVEDVKNMLGALKATNKGVFNDALIAFYKAYLPLSKNILRVTSSGIDGMQDTTKCQTLFDALKRSGIYAATHNGKADNQKAFFQDPANQQKLAAAVLLDLKCIKEGFDAFLGDIAAPLTALNTAREVAERSFLTLYDLGQFRRDALSLSCSMEIMARHAKPTQVNEREMKANSLLKLLMQTLEE